MSADAPRTVLHFAPHPDDELLGAPAALMALRDARFRVVNVACGLGSEEQRERREAEVRRASELAGFELFVPEELATLSSRDDRSDAPTQLGRIADEAIGEFRPELVVSPSPHDRHPAHELVGRAVRDALAEAGGKRRWWMWGLWGELPLPTIGVGFGEERLGEIVRALEAHEGELARNDYRRVLRGRGEMEASLGPELVFGFGSEGASSPYVERLTEVVRSEGRWLLGRPRWLEDGDVEAAPSDLDVTAWLDASTITDRFGPPGSQSRDA